MASRRSPVIRTAIQNLIGGVSQQPNSIRLENQCEVQDNAYSSVVDGLGKRQPTEHVRRLSEISSLTADKVYTHWINRDSTERYAVVFDNSLASPGFKIFDLDTGTEMTITGENNGTIDIDHISYLFHDPTGTDPNQKRDLKALTIADVTYILNKTVTCEMIDSPRSDSYARQGFPSGEDPYASISERRWFLFQRTANSLAKYAVRLHTKTGPLFPGAQKNTWDPPITSTTTPPASREYWLQIATSWVKTFNTDYARRHGTAPTTGYMGWGLANDQPPYDPANNLHEGYQIPTIQTQEVLERLWSEQSEGTPGTGTYYPGGIQDAYNDRAPLKIALGQTVGELFLGEYTFGSAPQRLLKPPQHGPVMKLELLRSTAISGGEASNRWREKAIVTVEAKGDLEDSLIAFGTEIDNHNLLPLVCEHGHVVKITGLEDNDSDEYYAEFVADDIGNEPQLYPTSNMGEGHWKEGVASNSKITIDNTTMPMKLVRVNDASKTPPYRFEFYAETWDEKLAGDDDSNPEPSFIGNEIEDIFLWRNRLGFLTKSRYVMSEADEYTNFWRTTVKQLLDSDPIDIDAGHNRVADLRFATPLEEDLIVWSDRTQFVSEGDPVLTPRTAGLAPVTEFEAYSNLRPEAVENGIFFARPSGGGAYSQVRQFHRVQDAAGSFDARPSSEQVPRYVKGKIVDMTATSLESVLVCRTDDADSRHILWVYKWLDRGADRILSAWMRFLVGPSYSTEIHGIQFIDDDLYLIVDRQATGVSNTIQLEKITFSGQRQVDDDGTNISAYRTFLDRRITEEDCTFAQDATGTVLEITLPYNLSDTAANTATGTTIVSRMGTDTGPEGEQFDFTEATVGSVSVLSVPDEDGSLYAAASGGTFLFYIGEDYTMTYEFSRPALREQTRTGGLAAIKTGRYQLLHGVLSYEDSGYFKMSVEPAVDSAGNEIVSRDTYDVELPLQEVGLGRSLLGSVNIRSGDEKFGIFGAPEEVRLILTNDSPYPCNPKSLELQARFSTVSRTFK
ncbi:MAG: hypothetical protein GY701_28760 [Sulfitobacter sp.]|nr:hypothetical protein [Sulfitobacter sp.]